jgi:hypothetical protein
VPFGWCVKLAIDVALLQRLGLPLLTCYRIFFFLVLGLFGFVWGVFFVFLRVCLGFCVLVFWV